MSDKPIPEVFDPRTIEEHGVTIPVPTPTAVDIPNPWKPAANGGRSPQQSPAAAAPESSSGPNTPSAKSDA